MAETEEQGGGRPTTDPRLDAISDYTLKTFKVWRHEAVLIYAALFTLIIRLYQTTSSCQPCRWLTITVATCMPVRSDLVWYTIIRTKVVSQVS